MREEAMNMQYLMPGTYLTPFACATNRVQFTQTLFPLLDYPNRLSDLTTIYTTDVSTEKESACTDAFH